MAYTQEELIEVIAIKVQEVVVPRIQGFMDGVTKEVHNMHLEMKSNEELNSAVLSQLNDLKTDYASLAQMREEVTQLHTTLYRNGFVKRFEGLCEQWTEYLKRDRFATCPAIRDIQDLKLKIENAPMIQKDTALKTWGIRVAIITAIINMAGIMTKLIGIW